MAKKRKKCASPNCVSCRWWPKICKMLGDEHGCYWIDRETGEMFIATGLRALPTGDFVEITDGPGFYEVQCACGDTGPVRSDLLNRGTVDRCPACTAKLAQSSRN